MSLLSISRPDDPDLSSIGSVTLWRGSLDSDGIDGEVEHDPRSQTIIELNPSTILLEIFSQGSTSICEDRIMNLGRKFALLDVFILLALLRNKNMIPAQWKYKRYNLPTRVHFAGTPLKDRQGRPCIACLLWNEPVWRCGLTPIASHIYENDVFAVLPS